MNNQVYPTNQDPNKVKKCSCEDKYGPKPFINSNTTVNPNNNTKSN